MLGATPSATFSLFVGVESILFGFTPSPIRSYYPKRLITHRFHSHTKQPRIQLFLVPKQLLETINRQMFGSPSFQNGNSRVYSHLIKIKQMDYLYRFHGRLSTHPNPSTVQKIPKVSPLRDYLPVHQPPFDLDTAPLVFTNLVKEVKFNLQKSSATCKQRLFYT